MADELDKFVLQYTVELKDSIARLEKLQQKVEGVSKAQNKTAAEAKKFAAGAADELGKLVPGLNNVTAATMRMGASFGAASVALAALAASVAAVIALRDKYNAQREMGTQIGASGMRIEEYQRKFQRYGGGRFTRQQTDEQLKKFSAAMSAAYADPSRMGDAAKAMKFLGVDVGERGKTPTSLNKGLMQAAAKLQKMSEAEATGMALQQGYNPEWVKALRKMGPQVGEFTEMSSKDMEDRLKAQEEVGKLNESIGKLKEAFAQMTEQLGREVIPAFVKLVEAITRLVEKVPEATKKAGDRIEAANKILNPNVIDYIKNFGNPESMPKGNVGSLLYDYIFGKKSPSAARQATQTTVQADKDKGSYISENEKEANRKKELAKKEDEQYEQGRQNADELQLAVNMFAAAVHSFSSAVNIQQAWAAWAGEVGKAGGLGGGNRPAAGIPTLTGGGGAAGGSRGIRNNNPGNLEYGPFAKSMGATGSDGRFAIFPSMAHGTAAMEALLSGSGYMGGGRNTISSILAKYAPASENDTAAYAAFVSKKTGIGANAKLRPDQISAVAAAMMIHESGYRGAGGRAQVFGESRETMAIKDVQENIARWTNIPIEQLQQGGATRGDLQWALGQTKAGVTNQITQLKQQLATAGLPQQTYAKLQNELAAQQRGLALLDQYGSRVVGQGTPGGRVFTVGEMPVYININGAQDQKAVGQEVNKAIRDHFVDGVNHRLQGMQG